MSYMKNFGRAAIASILCCISLSGCGGGGSEATDGRLYVVTTTTMISDLVEQIAGDKARVNGLMGPGVDPHTYEPVPSDGIALREADLIFYNGLFLEGQMSQSLESKGDRSHALGDSIPADRLKRAAAHPDPHIWGDASLWAGCVPGVVDALAKADPPNAAEYEQRGKVVAAQLVELHEWAKARAAEVPEAARILITSHDAFEYFGGAYGFKVVGLQGISTVGEVGIAERVKLVDYIKDHSVKAIFVESSVSHAAIESISEDAGVKVGGELFSDAMGQPGELEEVAGESYDVGTYIGMIKHNINTVVEALK
jgi:manganese/zinc/iron transport system substrate-binding protein